MFSKELTLRRKYFLLEKGAISGEEKNGNKHLLCRYSSIHFGQVTKGVKHRISTGQVINRKNMNFKFYMSSKGQVCSCDYKGS